MNGTSKHSIHGYQIKKLARNDRHPIKSAFSLPELLIALIAGAFIFLAANNLMLGHMRSSIRQETILRLQENWNRIRFIIDQDLNEGSGSCFTSASTLTIFSIQGDNTKTVTYELNASNQLIRTGPPIDANGSLNTGASSQSDIVADDVQVFSAATPLPSCSASTATKQINYNLALRETRNSLTSSYSNNNSAASGSSKIDPIN